MENQKAIEWLKAISAVQGNSIDKNSLTNRKEALYMAIQALRKAEPMKPYIFLDFYDREKNGCPKCHENNERNEILYAGQKYCSVCGQAIDWSE